MKTHTQGLLNGLNPEECSNALKYVNVEILYNSLADAIMSFVWKNTAEGEEYWYDVFSRAGNIKDINERIVSSKVNTNLISDGFHTFGELYDHRIALFIALCRYKEGQGWNGEATGVWRSKKHSDGSEWDGWFILGINKEPGEQITYHLPDKEWDNCKFAETLDQAPEFDGHTSNDVIERIKKL